MTPIDITTELSRGEDPVSYWWGYAPGSVDRAWEAIEEESSRVVEK